MAAGAEKEINHRMKPGGIKNPLPLAIVLGAISGVFVALAEHATAHGSSIRVTSLLPEAEFVSFLLLPAVLSFAARRRYFWWGFVPALTAAAVESITLVILAWSRPAYPLKGLLVFVFTSTIVESLLTGIPGVLVSSGLVSLIRWLVERRRNQSSPVPPAEEDLAIAGKDSAWPPAPRKE